MHFADQIGWPPDEAADDTGGEMNSGYHKIELGPIDKNV